MDETKTGWYRWIAENAQYFFWIFWGGLLGAFFASADTGLLHFFESHGEAVVAIFTMVLAASTIGLWTATRRLWQSGESQLAITAIAAAAADQSAKAATAAVDDAKLNAERQLRAYVTIIKHRAHKYRLQLGQRVEPGFTIVNRGQTPAHDVLVSIQADYVPAHQAESYRRKWDPFAPFTMMPGEESVMTADIRPLDAAMIQDLDAGKMVLLLLGELRYKDAFGRDRVTRMRASSNKDAVVDAKGRLQLYWHGSDNDAT